MPNPRLASRYAKALLDLSIEKGTLEEVYKDMVWLRTICKGSREFVNLLRSPIIHADAKKKILDQITSGRVNVLTRQFQELLITKNRESILPEVIPSFIDQYKQHKDIHTVKLTTAVPVSQEVKDNITAHIRKDAGYNNIDLEAEVNPDLIGGFVLEVGDKLVDASIAYDLREISRQFQRNEFIYRVR